MCGGNVWRWKDEGDVWRVWVVCGRMRVMCGG